jgi:hypothetical protein
VWLGHSTILHEACKYRSFCKLQIPSRRSLMRKATSEAAGEEIGKSSSKRSTEDLQEFIGTEFAEALGDSHS